MVYQYLELVATLGAVGDGLGPRLAIPDEVRAGAEEDLRRLGVEDDERLIALNPGASFGESKIWPVESLARVGDHYARKPGVRVVILCGPGEEELARSLERAMTETPVNTAGAIVPLDRSKAVIQRAELLITTDTGPRHIAVSVGTPTVVLMGPTDPRYTNSHLERTIVLRRDVPCGPCHLKVCPLDHRCMTLITPDDVIEAGDRLLEMS
jgi:heptosyltransferase-2